MATGLPSPGNNPFHAIYSTLFKASSSSTSFLSDAGLTGLLIIFSIKFITKDIANANKIITPLISHLSFPICIENSVPNFSFLGFYGKNIFSRIILQKKSANGLCHLRLYIRKLLAFIYFRCRRRCLWALLFYPLRT